MIKYGGLPIYAIAGMAIALVLVIIMNVQRYYSSVGKISGENIDSVWVIDGGIDAYEFTPKTASYMKCIYVDGHRRGGLHCFEKKAKE